MSKSTLAPVRALSFNNTQLNIIDRDGQVWLTSSEIAQALGYKDEKSVTRIYIRNADEFTSSMSEVINLTTSGNLQKTVRIFSLRGAHLIGMFARTPIAKKFRVWVLDVLDRETSRQNKLDRMSLEALCSHMVWLEGWWTQYQAAVRGFNRSVASSVHDHFNDGFFVASGLIYEHKLDVVPSSVAREYPFSGTYQEKHDYYVLTKNRTR